jgi:phage terminase small subunit
MAALEKEGYVIQSGTVTKANPAADVATRFARIALDCLTNMGLNPAGRRRLRVDVRKPRQSERLRRFLAGIPNDDPPTRQGAPDEKDTENE